MSKLSTRASVRTPMFLAAAAAAIAVTALVGCGSDPVTPPSQANVLASSVQAQLDADFKAARRATARFHSFEQATKENYTFLFADMCMADASVPSAGAMGYHFVNTDLLSGDAPTVDKPQALIYEPQANGSNQLVALEYVVPGSLWLSANPPQLFGEDFSWNAGFGLWTLHVWLYKANPSGIFAPWNPNVSCQYAS